MGKILLLVEDDKNLNKINRLALSGEGYIVYTALTLAQARKQLTACNPDLILLDVMLPDGNGYDFCKEIREQPQLSAVPVLFLTSVTDNAGEMEGLRSGGNDYLRKPYDIALLRLRVANLLKLQECNIRQAKAEQKMITKGKISIDTVARRAYVDGEDMNLQAKQFGILVTLVQHESQFLSASKLYEIVWAQPMVGNSQALRKAVHGVRSQIAGSGYSITYEKGSGYCFERGE